MRGLIIAAIVLVLAIAAFAFGLVNINQAQETKMPQVAVKGGQAPAFDVSTARVEVGSKTTNVDVPTVSVDSRKEAIDVPVIDVEKAR